MVYGRVYEFEFSSWIDGVWTYYTQWETSIGNVKELNRSILTSRKSIPSRILAQDLRAILDDPANEAALEREYRSMPELPLKSGTKVRFTEVGETGEATIWSHTLIGYTPAYVLRQFHEGRNFFAIPAADCQPV